MYQRKAPGPSLAPRRSLISPVVHGTVAGHLRTMSISALAVFGTKKTTSEAEGAANRTQAGCPGRRDPRTASRGRTRAKWAAGPTMTR